MTYSIVANECIFVTCPHCGGDTRKQSNMPSGFCEECINTGEVGEDVSDLMCLVHNLAIAGALCRAHEIGEGSGYEWATREPIWPRWEPGCLQDASKAEEARRRPGAFADIYGDRSKWRLLP